MFHDGAWRGVGLQSVAGLIGPVGDIVPAGETPPPPPDVVTVPPTFFGMGSLKASTGAMRPNWPAGHLADDVALLVVESANDVVALTDAQGFVSVTAQIGTGTASGATSTRLALFWCRATSSAMPSPQVGFATTGDHIICRILVFRGCVKTGNPWDVLGTSDVAAAATTAVSMPGFTTVSEQTLAVAIVAWATETAAAQLSGETNASLTSLTERHDEGSVSGNGGGFAVVTGIRAVAGAVSATTGTLATSSVQARMSLALMPAEGSTAPPPESGTFRTMVGAYSVPKALRGWTTVPPSGNPLKPTPDVKFSDSNGANHVGPSGHIQHARDHGYCYIPQVTGASGSWADPTTGDFSPTIWNAAFDEWADELEAQEAWGSYTGGEDELRQAVRDGVFRCLFVLDDFIAPRSSGAPNGFAHAVPYESIENICEHVKTRWPWMPTCARGVATYLRDAAILNGTVRQYRWLDAAMAQWRSSHDTPTTPTGTLANYTARALAYVDRQVAAGIECGLTVIGGANILNRGDGADPAWGYVQGDNPCRPERCPKEGGMSPNEIKAIGLTCMANPNIVGWVIWAYDGQGDIGDTYYNRAEILAALQVVYDASVGRLDPPINRRGDIQLA